MLLSNNPEAEIEIDGVYRSGFGGNKILTMKIIHL